MAGKTLFKLVRKPRDSKIQGKILNKHMRKELKKIGSMILPKYNAAVANWSGESKPSFVVVVASTKSRVELMIRVKNQAGTKPYMRWKMVDSEGREGGTVYTSKSRDKPMRFQRGYNRKVRSSGGLATIALSGSRGAPGSRYGQWVSTYKVTQGEVKPSYFSNSLMDLYKPFFQRAMENAYRRAYREIFGR